MAVRVALGAPRGRLINPVLAECLLLGLSGGAAGAAMAVAVSNLLRRLTEGQIPRMEWTLFQAPVWWFGLGISVLAAVLFALPACGQVWPAAASPGTTRSVSKRRSWFSSVLMACEVAIAFVLLSGAALLF